MTKIEGAIEEIEDYIANCKPAPFSGNRKIMVDKDEMQDLLTDLRLKTPDEVKKYQQIISNKESILRNAHAQAETIITDAKKQKDALVNDSVIKHEAEQQAKSIIDEAQEYSRIVTQKANEEAEAIRVSAIEYTDSLLAHVQEVIVNSLEAYRNNYSDMVSALQSDYESIMANRNDLISDDSSEKDTSEN